MPTRQIEYFNTQDSPEVVETNSEEYFLRMLSLSKKYHFKALPDRAIAFYVPTVAPHVILALCVSILLLVLIGGTILAGFQNVAMYVLANVFVPVALFTVTVWITAPKWRKFKVPASYENMIRNTLLRETPEVKTMKTLIIRKTYAGQTRLVEHEKVLKLSPEQAHRFKQSIGSFDQLPPVPAEESLDTLSDQDFMQAQHELLQTNWTRYVSQ